MTGLRVIGAWSATAAALLLILGWGPLVAWADLHPNMAAWVQAIGSIAAILVAIWVSHWQDGRARRLRIETAVRASRTFAGLLEVAAKRVIEIAPNNQIGQYKDIMALLEEVMIDGRAIEHELLNIHWTGAIQGLRSTGAQMLEYLRSTQAHHLQGNWQSVTIQTFRHHCTEIAKCQKAVTGAHPGIKIKY